MLTTRWELLWGSLSMSVIAREGLRRGRRGGVHIQSKKNMFVSQKSEIMWLNRDMDYFDECLNRITKNSFERVPSTETRIY